MLGLFNRVWHVVRPAAANPHVDVFAKERRDRSRQVVTLPADPQESGRGKLNETLSP